MFVDVAMLYSWNSRCGDGIEEDSGVEGGGVEGGCGGGFGVDGG